jgi:hypothetical protein
MTNKQIIAAINKQVQELGETEKEEINELLKYHECEPMAQAERIAALLNVSYECIYDIIFQL